MMTQVNPLTTPRNEIAAEVHQAIAAQVLRLEPSHQREYLRRAIANLHRVAQTEKEAAKRARQQRQSKAHNARLMAKKARKDQRRPPRRKSTRAQRRQRQR